MFRRGIPLGPRPLEGERAGGACGDDRDAAGGGGAADAVEGIYADFSSDSGEGHQEKRKSTYMGFKVVHLLVFSNRQLHNCKNKFMGYRLIFFWIFIKFHDLTGINRSDAYCLCAFGVFFVACQKSLQTGLTILHNVIQQKGV